MKLYKVWERRIMTELEELCYKSTKIRMALLDQLAAAFLLATDLAPEECMLVQQIQGTKICYWFEKKEHNKWK